MPPTTSVSTPPPALTPAPGFPPELAPVPPPSPPPGIVPGAPPPGRGRVPFPGTRAPPPFPPPFPPPPPGSRIPSYPPYPPHPGPPPPGIVDPPPPPSSWTRTRTSRRSSAPGRFKFNKGLWDKWRRPLQFLGAHHILIMVNVFAIIVLSFLLAGCSSANGLKNVYLLSLSYNTGGVAAPPDSLQTNPNMTAVFADIVVAGNETIEQINVGFTSVCVKTTTGPWLCGADLALLVSDLRRTPGSDPLNLVWLAENFRTGILWYGLTIAAIILVFIDTILLTTYPKWITETGPEGSEREIKPFPSRPVVSTKVVVMTFATLFSLVSAIWQHMASATTSTMTSLLTYDTVDGSVGAAAMALAWAGVLLIGGSWVTTCLSKYALWRLAQLAD